MFLTGLLLKSKCNVFIITSHLASEHTCSLIICVSAEHNQQAEVDKQPGTSAAKRGKKKKSLLFPVIYTSITYLCL